MRAQTLSAAWIRRAIPPRPRDSQKGKNGHLLIVAGSRDMPGAAILSCLGALKTGAGLVTLASVDSVRAVAARRLPEVMSIPVSSIRTYVHRRAITTLAAGPGLTVHSSVRHLIKNLLKMDLPTVLDADGLNNSRPTDLKKRQVIITPHPGELARLLGLSVKQVQKDRIKVARTTAMRFGIVCVLKGHHTVISDGHLTCINPTGNPAMATAGMGDVLTGVIAALLAQGLPLFKAACAGVYLHGLAADLARVSDRGLLASEVAMHVPNALRKIGVR